MARLKAPNKATFIRFITIFILFFMLACNEEVRQEPAKEQWEIDHLDFTEYKCTQCHWKDGTEKFNHSEYLGKKDCTACHYKKNLTLFKHDQLKEKEKCEKCHIPLDDMIHSMQQYCPSCHTTENWEKKEDKQ